MELDKIYLGKWEDVTSSWEHSSLDLVFADPPFNIGLDYDVYNDKLPYNEYFEWTQKWVAECYRLLKPNGSIYVSIGDEFAAEVNIALKRAGFHFRNWLVWHYTFGQCQKLKFSRSHTHILYFVKDPSHFTFNATDILVPSARQLVYKDKRAKSGGKVPDDTWAVYAKDVEVRAHELKLYPEDTVLWTDSRLCGTFKERVVKADGSAHPCQMPLSILRRIITTSSNKGEIVYDPFLGTGTTVVAAKELGRRFLGTEMSEEYFKVTNERLAAVPHP